MVSIDWCEYSRVHTTRANLIIHLFAVPLFIASIISLAKTLLRGDWVSSVIVIVCAFIAMALQGRGHKKETEPPKPFTSPANFLRRWFTEQFLIFPLFLLSGRWWRQYQSAVDHRES